VLPRPEVPLSVNEVLADLGSKPAAPRGPSIRATGGPGLSPNSTVVFYKLEKQY